MNIERYQEGLTTQLLDLLLMADPDRMAITVYLEGSTIYVARDSNVLIGVAVITHEKECVELKNLAVKESHQQSGVAKELIATAKSYARESGATCIQVGTGNSSLSQLALYQKCGFRMQSIKQDYFANYPEPIIENGIRCLDRVVLNASL